MSEANLPVEELLYLFAKLGLDVVQAGVDHHHGHFRVDGLAR